MQNDGSEQVELHQSNVFEIGQLQREIRMAKAQAGDGYRQLNGAMSLLKECRNLLELVMDTQLHEQIQVLIKKIDAFKGD